SESGTKVASKNDEAQLVSLSKEPQANEKVNQQAVRSFERVIEATKEREELNKEERERLVEQMNNFISSINKGLSFRVDEESGKEVVTIYEADTGDIIRQ
ncbi:flagellar protein FlaG, partial [Vibrio xuii]